MAKVGDTVRYLNSVGGGKIVRIDGKMAYVDDDGFETPMLIKELVVVMPAGHEAQKANGNSANLMFDQKAFDAGRQPEPQTQVIVQDKAEETELPIEETAYGEKINVVLAFEPRNIKQLSSTSFSAVLVNDSNYFLYFTFLVRSDDEHGWKLKYSGTIEPNMLADLADFAHGELPQLERIAFQCIAFKKDKTFSLKAPVSISQKIDLTKFYKMHCFRPGVYFDTPVLEFPLIKDDVPSKALQVNTEALAEAMMSKPKDKDIAKQLSAKFNVDKGRNKAPKADNAANPNKLLPIVEVDLHIGELVDTTAGMNNTDMLNLQLDTVRKTMSQHSRRKGQKIVFIHGKGEGVLRKAVLELLKKEYPKAELQDASFREYGFGATLVTIH